MKVEATQAGFYQRVYEAGETFDIPSELFSETWMKKVGPGRPPKKAAEPEMKKEEEGQ